MGGYGFTIGETKTHTLNIRVNMSGKYQSYSLELHNKETDRFEHIEEFCREHYPNMDVAVHELEKEYSMFCIKDQELRDKVQFERDFRILEEKYNKEHKYNIKLRSILDKINDILKDRFPIGLMHVADSKDKEVKNADSSHD